MKKGLIIGALVLLVAAGVLVFVLTTINSIVKAAIERYGSQATKTAVNVSSVKIELASGRGTLTGLSVANPPGFVSPNIFLLKEISLQIPVKTLSKKLVVVDQVRVAGPEVFLEMDRSGTTNIEVLKKNLQGTERTPPGRAGTGKESEVRISIRKFLFENGKVHVRLPPPHDRSTDVELPRMELTNIGGTRGVSPAEAATIVAKALAEQAAGTVLRTEGQKALQKGAEGLLKRYLEK